MIKFRDILNEAFYFIFDKHKTIEDPLYKIVVEKYPENSKGQNVSGLQPGQIKALDSRDQLITPTSFIFADLGVPNIFN